MTEHLKPNQPKAPHSKNGLLVRATGLVQRFRDFIQTDDSPAQPLSEQEAEVVRGISRRTLLTGAGIMGAAAALGVLDETGAFDRKPSPPKALEHWKDTFERMSSAELAQWILEATGNEATAKQPVRTPETTSAYKDLKNTADGKPAYRQTLLTLDDEKIKMDVEVNRDILMFRALLTVALQDPANYFEGQPILIQSGQLTNRSGSHKGRQDRSHFYGNSIDFSGAIIDGGKSDDDPDNLYPYDSEINRQLGIIADTVGKLIEVKTPEAPASLERVDSLRGTPGLSKGHYHYNADTTSATKHANIVRDSIKKQSVFGTVDPIIDLGSAGISESGRGFIHTYEKFRSETYGDAGAGQGTLTIGYGATYYLSNTVITRGNQEILIEDNDQKPELGDTITKEEADRLSEKMIEREYLQPVIAALERNDLTATQSQLDALVSYAFHRGGGNASKLIGRLKALAEAGFGNDKLAIRAAFMYDINDKVSPKFRRGVADRYLDTADIFIHGDYKRQDRPFDPQGWDAVIAAYFD